MDPRTWIVALIGSILVGTAAVLSGLDLNPQGCSGAAAYVDPSYCPPRMEVLWFEPSDKEVIIWSVIVGGTAGALLGLLVDRLFRRLVPLPATRRGISAIVVVSVLAACTGPHPAPPSSPVQESDPFARYFFSASGMHGVLEVIQSPPSICYSTQSSPARPISIISSGFVSGPPPGAPSVTYAPRGNDFCDRMVEPALAEAMILDPSAYVIRWLPEGGAPAVSSSLVEQNS